MIFSNTTPCSNTGTQSGTNAVECSSCSFWYILNTGNCEGTPIFAIIFAIVMSFVVLSGLYFTRKILIDRRQAREAARKRNAEIKHLKGQHGKQFMKIWKDYQIDVQYATGLLSDSIITLSGVKDVYAVKRHIGALVATIDGAEHTHDVFVKIKSHAMDIEIDLELVRTYCKYVSRNSLLNRTTHECTGTLRKVSCHESIVVFMDITETSKLVTSAFEKSSSDRMRRFDSDAETVQSFCAIFDSSPLGSLQDKLTKHEETSFSGQHYVDTGAVTRKRVKRADSDDLRGEVRTVL